MIRCLGGGGTGGGCGAREREMGGDGNSLMIICGVEMRNGIQAHYYYFDG